MAVGPPARTRTRWRITMKHSLALPAISLAVAAVPSNAATARLMAGKASECFIVILQRVLVRAGGPTAIAQCVDHTGLQFAAQCSEQRASPAHRTNPSSRPLA